MDWMNRDIRQNQSVNHTGGPAVSVPHSKRLKTQGWLKLVSGALLFSAALLIVALLLYTSFGGKVASEGKYVDTSKYQAIFLNGGQVYFGHIKTLNNRFVRVDDIYYLRVNQTVQPNQQNNQANDVSLVKLGCELHGPQDQMVINREQVIFWENLKADGQVAKAVAVFKQQNPNGQKCETTSTSNSTSTPSSTTPTTTKH